MAPRYPLRNRGPILQTPSPLAPMPGTLADEIQRAESVGLSTLSSLPPSARRSHSEVVPGLTYSQVASRSPSPDSSVQVREELTSTPVDRSNNNITYAKSEGNLDEDRMFAEADISNFLEPEGPEWSTVSYKRRRSKSLPLSEVGETPLKETRVQDISADKFEAIKLAEQGLTPSKKGRVQKRMNMVREFNQANREYGQSQDIGEGTSKEKGKTIDPLNWGACGIPENELNPEAQRRELESYEAQDIAKQDDLHLSIEQQRQLLNFYNTYHQSLRNDETRATKLEEEKIITSPKILIEEQKQSPEIENKEPTPEGEKPTTTKKYKTKSTRRSSGTSSESESKEFKPAEAVVDLALRTKSKTRKDEPKRSKKSKSLAPSTQVEGESYLGQILSQSRQRDKEKETRDGGEPPSSSSSSSSGSSSDDSDSDSSDQSSTDSESSDSSKGHRNRSRNSKRKGHDSKKKYNRKKRSHPRLKPEKPEKYDGTPNAEKFHRFARQAQDFLKGYKVKPRRVATTLSNYLEGKAYSFYANTVSDRPEKWTFRELLIGIFDYCFPLSFRNQQRMRLHNFRQRDLTVRDFSHELENLFRMVGVMSKQEKVDKLWYGLNRPIRIKLTEHGLSPILSSWKRILRKANFMEAAIKSEEGHQEPKIYNANRNAGPSSRRPPRNSNPPAQRQTGNLQSRNSNKFTDKPNFQNNFSRNNGNTRFSVQRQPQPARNAPSNNRLSEKEKAEWRAAGKCFECGETSHIARNCPKNNRVKSNNKGRPPGISTYSLSLGQVDIEDLRVLAGSTKSTEAISLNGIGVEWEELPACDGPSVESDELDDLPELMTDPEDDTDDEDDCDMTWDELDEEPPSSDSSDSDSSSSDRNSLSSSDSELTKWESDSDWDEELCDSGDSDVEICPDYCQCLWDSSFDTESHFLRHPIYKDTDSESESNKDDLQAMSSRHDLDRPAFDRINNLPYERLGDPYAERAQNLLKKHTPYKVGNNFEQDDDLIVYRTCDDHYCIMSGSTDIDILVEGTYLRSPSFDLPAFYHYRLSTRVLHCENTPYSHLRYETMGEVRTKALQHILSSRLGLSPQGFKFSDGLGGVWIAHTDVPFHKFMRDEVFLEPRYDIASSYLKAAKRHRQTMGCQNWNGVTTRDLILFEELENGTESPLEEDIMLELNATYPIFNTIQRNAATARDIRRLIPEPIVVIVDINGHHARALLDSGSLADFISTKFAQQIKAKTFELEKPLPVQLAVQGSRTKVNYGCRAMIEYQDIKEDRYFDVCNLGNYDIVLGTPFLYQHKASIGLNPTSVLIGSIDPLPIEGKRVRVLESRAADVLDEKLDHARRELREYAEPICKEASDSPLPPLRAVNHTIPLIDSTKIYPWRPSKCPDAHRASWAEKRDAYLKSGRWRISAARNTAPMLLLTKPGTGKKGVPPRLRVVADLRERNKNTRKLTSPLPDMEGILRRLARKPYRSLMDGKDAYEQIRVEPEDVERTAMTTPDGNMVSLVMQQGDCNAVATYQSLMNHIFAPFLGVFMDVYLDDIVIYSDSLEDHIKHVKIIIDVLKKEKLYLSATKLHFLEKEMKVLGRIVDDKGIRMDPDKVDNVLNWKVPTTKELLRGFLGSVGYLADDIATVRVPMGILTPLVGSTSSFHWEPTHQRAFDEIKQLVQAHREHHRVPLNYAVGAPHIWLITDGSLAGISGVISQGEDWKKGQVAAFFSAKLSPAQMNYPVHEIEMLAGVEAMRRHRDILLGCYFTWITDHKGLTHLHTQKNLSGRQARWFETIAEFDFDIKHVPGIENILADALSRIYAYDSTGTVRSPSEYTEYDENEAAPTHLALLDISMPVYTALEAAAAQPRGRVNAPPPEKPSRTKVVAPPESGRKETAREFSKRIKRVILHGPRAERQEGGSTPTEYKSKPQIDQGDTHLISGTSKPQTEPAKLQQSTSQGPEQQQNMWGRQTAPPSPQNESKQGGASAVAAPTPKDAVPGMEPMHLPNMVGGALKASSGSGFQAFTHRLVTEPTRARPNKGKGLAFPYKEAARSRQPEPVSQEGTVAEAGRAETISADLPKKESALLGHISSTTGGINVMSEVKNQYWKDNFFREILKNPKHHKNFDIHEGLVFLRDHNKLLLCIPNIAVHSRGRNLREIIITHAHSLLAHLGANKTLHYLRDHVWWKTMARDIRQFCETCMTCRRSKPNNQKPYGLLNPLAVPTKPWETIGVDFVGPLPESKDRNGTYDSITVIIDLLTSMVHLVPSKITHTAKQVAELLFAEVYKHHGLPKAIVSDRDVIFTSTFWTHLNRLLGVELRMSSAYHPESDGSTERANRTITQMLRNCVGSRQRDWVTKLPAIEFAVNSARSESTGYAPFFLNHGRMPRSMIWNNPGEDEYPAVRAYAQKVKYAIMAAHDSILSARVKQTRDANRRRRPSPFVKGDLVYVSTKNMSLPRGLARKLIPKFIGPYKILVDYGNNSYQIELSANLKRRGIHNVFHSSLLRSHEPNDDRLFPGRHDSQVTELEDQEEEWMIDRVLSHKGAGDQAIFECAWKSGDQTWMPYDSLAQSEALKAYLELLGIDTISNLTDGTGVPPEDNPQVYIGSILAPLYRQLYLGFPQEEKQSPKLRAVYHLDPKSPNSIHYTTMTTPYTSDLMYDPTVFRRLPEGLVFYDSLSGRDVFMTFTQVHECFLHDKEVRTGKVEAVGIMPLGYDQLAPVFNKNPHHNYRLSPYYLRTDDYEILGRPVPDIEAIAPRATRVQTEREVREEQARADSMLLVVEGAVRQSEFRKKKYQERFEKRRAREVYGAFLSGGGRGGRRGRGSSIYGGGTGGRVPYIGSERGSSVAEFNNNDDEHLDEDAEGDDEQLDREMSEQLFGPEGAPANTTTDRDVDMTPPPTTTNQPTTTPEATTTTHPAAGSSTTNPTIPTPTASTSTPASASPGVLAALKFKKKGKGKPKSKEVITEADEEM
ncbi:hypothetical protein NLI96_g6704 [Meripilus lineatus]|uniref:RNA-directed DNA polymerase n=1 Tax=Meripilus lineatus TaxID=2056292 RepID=A0AAD5YHV5_9APHY|nr:hypothetical protein NLI96_g6704 [Physisporinus lineatus]